MGVFNGDFKGGTGENERLVNILNLLTVSIHYQQAVWSFINYID